MRNSGVTALGLFPILDNSGGIQRAGRLACDAINTNGWPTVRTEIRKLYVFCCGLPVSDCRYQPENIQEIAPITAETIHTSSKIKAAIAAAKWKRSVQLIMVWHVGLLKLLPFFRMPEAKIALFLHGIEAWRPQDWFTRLLLRRVDVFLTNSEYTWERFIFFNPGFSEAPHEVVPLGIGVPMDSLIPGCSDPPAALMISRLLRRENYKGHFEMISAWPLVMRRIPEAELWIAGDGDLLQDLQQMVDERSLSRHVRFFGSVSEAEKQRLLENCRCLAMPSRGEGFGLVYLEAMRIGRPCLVSTVDAAREVIRPPAAGLAADPGNSQALSDAVCRMMTPGSEWEFWSSQARACYERYFTARHFQERLQEALQPLMT